MRSTRASAAWAGIALATSFLSVTIIGTQPHTSATSSIAQSAALPSSRLEALTSDDSRRNLQPTAVVDGDKLAESSRNRLTDRGLTGAMH